MQNKTNPCQQALTAYNNIPNSENKPAGLADQTGLADQAGTDNIHNLTSTFNDQVPNLREILIKAETQLKQQLNNISQKDSQIERKKIRQQQQLREIEEKRKLILTRNRMLQITQERNIYKKKIIYTLIAFIIAAFVFMLVCYVYFNKKQ